VFVKWWHEVATLGLGLVSAVVSGVTENHNWVTWAESSLGVVVIDVCASILGWMWILVGGLHRRLSVCRTACWWWATRLPWLLQLPICTGHLRSTYVIVRCCFCCRSVSLLRVICSLCFDRRSVSWSFGRKLVWPNAVIDEIAARFSCAGFVFLL